MAKKVGIFGVEINVITTDQALLEIETWMKGSGKHYVVTPNIEFIMQAQHDRIFRSIINSADLAVPDSARLNWAAWMVKQRHIITRLIYWPFFLLPQYSKFNTLKVVTGTDLMEDLIKECNDKGFRVGLLGGRRGIALKLADRLKERYPRLKIAMALSNVEVNNDGRIINGNDKLESQELPIDILFVAFGQGKQEKWIAQNLRNFPAKVMIGVGGAFDYLSGNVPRAPIWMRKSGFEWLYRIIIQPWRIRRFKALIIFIIKVLFC